MKQILVISGKGGTGKTTIAAAFASLAKNAVLADCDVDAPDLHIILRPKVLNEEPFFALRIPRRDESKCIECGKCKEACRFDAIDESFNPIPVRCEGCAACAFVCPEKAIEMVDREAGKLYISKTRFGPFVHAKLNIGEEASGKLVTEVKKRAKQLAEKEGKELILTDGSPGIGCPVIASLAGVDLALIVTEPTVSGIHDLGRILEVTKHFKVKAAVCINKFDINEKKTADVERFCMENKIPVVGRIPYDLNVSKAMIKLETVIEFPSGEVTKAVEEIWKKLMEMSKDENPHSV